MNDKLLFENWRKFLVEERPPESLKMDRDIAQGRYVAPTYQEPEPEEAEHECITVLEVIATIVGYQESTETKNDIDASLKKLRAHVAEFGSDYVLAAILTPIFGPLGGVGVVAALRGGRLALKRLRNAPPDLEKGIDAFVDKINISDAYQQYFNEETIRDIDNQYIKALRKFAADHGDVCIGSAPLHLIDINEFIKKHYQICQTPMPPATIPPTKEQAAANKRAWELAKGINLDKGTLRGMEQDRTLSQIHRRPRSAQDQSGAMFEHMNHWRQFAKEVKVIKEATEFDEEFERLFKSGAEGIKQAVEFAEVLGIPTQDLPWGPKSIYQFVNPENRGMMQSDFAKLVDAQEEITGWGFEKYDSAVSDLGDARQVASGEVSPEEMAKYHGMEVDSDEWTELWASWQKYIQPYTGSGTADMYEQKLLKESYTDWGSIGLDQVSEDDLYDLDYDELYDLQDYIESGGSDPKDLLSTVKARIEAIEEEDYPRERPPDRQVENLYDGEFILKLMRAFFISANQGIELSSMIPGAESLSEEFKRTREQVSMLIQYAEDKDYSPWLYAGTEWEKEINPDAMTNNIRLLMNQIVKPDEPEGGITEEEQEIIDGYHKWIDSVDGLKLYAKYSLHGAAGQTAQRWTTEHEKYIAAYDFITDWVGVE